MCPARSGSGGPKKGSTTHAPPSVASAPDLTSEEVRLPDSLRSLVNGLRRGVGITSQRSLSMIGGVRPDLVPIVVCLSRDAGFTTFLTSLATLSALREEGSGDVILMLSFNLGVGAFTSLLATSAKDGKKGVITFEISMPQPAPDGTYPST